MPFKLLNFEIFKFANKHLPKNRSQATAVYLASTNSKESEILDKSGIPRDNRIILEGDESKVPKVQEANPGIRVIPIKTTDFLKEEAKSQKYSPFSYCGLDYECMLNEHVTTDLNIIAHNNLMQDEGMIYTNLVGYREQRSTQEDYLVSFFRSFPESKESIKGIFGPDFNPVNENEKYHSRNLIQCRLQ